MGIRKKKKTEEGSEPLYAVPQRVRRRSVKGPVFLTVLLVVGTAGYFTWRYYLRDTFGIGKAQELVTVQRVRDMMEEQAQENSKWYAGVVETQEQIKVKIAEDRKVSETKVTEGDFIHKGDLLFEYDLEDLQNSLTSNRLEYDILVSQAAKYQQEINEREAKRTEGNFNAQLDNAILLEQARLNLQQNLTKQKEMLHTIESQEEACQNTQVFSEVDGTVLKINRNLLGKEGEGEDDSDDFFGYSGGSNEDSDAFITITATGDYRVKGTLSETERYSLTPGTPMIVRSRVNESQTWTGVLGEVDEKNATESDSEDMSDSGGQSTKNYPFYVWLDSTDGLMLGQHVYIELDEGQQEQSEGVWIDLRLITGTEDGDTIVWIAGPDGRLVSRSVTLGEIDNATGLVKIESGLGKNDSIAYPEEGLEEGMKTVAGEVLLEDEEDWGEEEWDDSEWDESEWDDSEWDDSDWDDSDWDDSESDDSEWEEVEDGGYVWEGGAEG